MFDSGFLLLANNGVSCKSLCRTTCILSVEPSGYEDRPKLTAFASDRQLTRTIGSAMNPSGVTLARCP